MADFEGLPFELQVKAVDAYREFLIEYSAKTSHGKFSSLRFSTFAEAWANGNFDCFYAGWPSRSSPKPGGGRLCNSPKNANPDYRSLASSCDANSLLCQPAVFGSGLCVSVATAALRNSALQQCDQRFRESGRTTADVVRELNTPEKRADFEELMAVSERVCRDGFQPGICNRLREKLAAVSEAAGATLITATQTAVAVTSEGVEPTPEVDCDPDTPGIQTRPPEARPQVPVQAPIQVALSGRIIRKSCTPPALTGAAPSASELLPQLAANNIHIVSGEISDTRHLTNFLSDFNKFPAPLREEMRRNGSRINLIFGRGVSEDPSWGPEASRSPNPNAWQTTHDGRPWSEVPGSGGSLGVSPTPTRLVVNRLYEGHGASNLFLHEYAHTLDSMYGHHAITASPIWRQAVARDARARDFIQAICGNYCNDTAHPEEAFAELFAYYHACGETKGHMRQLMPNVSSLFDRMTSVRDLLDGRIPVEVQPSLLATAGNGPGPQPQRQSAGLVVSAADGMRQVSNTGNLTPQLATMNRPVAEAPLVVAQSERRPQSEPGRESVLNPNSALEMVANGQLRYLGRGLLPGSDTVGSCVFSNDEVYVIVHLCRRDGQEAPATSIDIITRDGQRVNYYLENSESTDRTVGPPSQVRRQNYDRIFRISYQRLGPAPATYSLEGMRQYLQRGVTNVGSNCFTGGMGMNLRDTTSVCSGDMVEYQSSWQPVADAFYQEPGEGWYSFLRSMRQQVQANTR